MEPITLSLIGTTTLTEGIKFLYAQAGELLRAWRERHNGGDNAPLSARLTIPEADLFEDTPQSAEANAQVVGKLAPELRVLWQTLAPYASGIDEIEPQNPDLLAIVDALRRSLEAIYSQRLSFKGEQRSNSDPVVIGRVDVDEILGYVAGVRSRSIRSGNVQGTLKADTVLPGGNAVGVDVDAIE